MTEHYFPLKIPSIQTQLRVLAPISNQGVHVHMGQLQRSDVTTAPRAHTSDVTFSKF